jgi:transcriptional regulator with XRE-family HTH domain
MQTITREIGNRLQNLREARGLTLAQLAEMVGLSQAQVSRLETGKQGFRSATLRRFADILRVKVTTLFCGEKTDPRSAISSDAGRYGPGIPDELKAALQHEEFRRFVEKSVRIFMMDGSTFDTLTSLVRKTKI